MRSIARVLPRFLLGLILVCSLVVGSCQGQNPGLPIQPGDIVTIHVYDTPELEQVVRVSLAGDVELLLIGNVHIAGLSPGAAAALIEKVLVEKQVMKHPSLTVTVMTNETGKNPSVTVQQVAVGGEVKLPGPQQITTSRSAIDLIALAGGLTDLADRRNITVRHNGNPESFTKFYYSDDPNEALKNDVMVQPGDSVLVPQVGLVYVLGDVGRAGAFPMNQPDSVMTVLRAISLAAGTNHTATPSNSRLVRKTPNGGVQEIKLNISRMQKGKLPDVPLLPGDILYVPFSYLKNALALGAGNLFTTAAQAAIYVH